MAEHPTVEEILTTNPQIDEEKLEEAREILRKLREGRVGRAGYKLGTPFLRRRILVGDRDREDSRTIRLGRTKR